MATLCAVGALYRSSHKQLLVVITISLVMCRHKMKYSDRHMCPPGQSNFKKDEKGLKILHQHLAVIAISTLWTTFALGLTSIHKTAHEHCDAESDTQADTCITVLMLL